MKRLFVSISLITALSLMNPAIAQVIPKFFELLTSQSSSNDFTVSDRGFVRLQLKIPSDPWSLLLIDPTGVRTVISGNTVERYQIYPNTIELPIGSAGTVHIESSGALKEIMWESFIPDISGTPLFRQGGPLERIDTKFRANPENKKIVDLSAAIVRVRWAAPYLPTRWCTGVQIEPGTILTNRHCLPPEFNVAAPKGEVVVQFGEFNNSLDDVAETIPAIVLSAIKTNNSSNIYEKDMAVLKLKNLPKSDHYRKAIVSMASTSTSGKPSLLLSIWSYDSPTGKAVSRGPLCKADLDQEAAWNCSKPIGLYHQCETEEGSSGSPIIDKITGEMIGLHYLGVAPNGGNCALRIEQIRAELKSTPQQ